MHGLGAAAEWSKAQQRAAAVSTLPRDRGAESSAVETTRQKTPSKLARVTSEGTQGRIDALYAGRQTPTV